MDKKVIISQMDLDHLSLIRNNIKIFIENLAKRFDNNDLKILDIAPQVHNGAKEFFKKATIDTLDIDPNSNATFIADLCKDNSYLIDSNSYDIILCTEVLEHTLQPFSAVNEIYRMLKPGGLAGISTPFNFRIHGPLPDCWRFSEHGLRELFKDFSDCKIIPLETDKRDLFPIHYTTEVVK